MSSGQPPSDRPPAGGQSSGMIQQPGDVSGAPPQQPSGPAQPVPQRPQVIPAATPARPARSLVRVSLLVVMNVLFLIGLLLLARLIMAFFGPLRGAPVFSPLVSLSDPLVLPLKLAAIKTPFKGFFEVTTAVTIIVILVVEYLLGTVRRNT